MQSDVHNFSNRWLWLFAPGLVLVHVSTVLGLVNPQLQPSHLIERHQVVAGFTISDVDYDNGRVTLKVVNVCIGQLTPKRVAIGVPEVDFDAEYAETLEVPGP